MSIQSSKCISNVKSVETGNTVVKLFSLVSQSSIEATISVYVGSKPTFNEQFSSSESIVNFLNVLCTSKSGDFDEVVLNDVSTFLLDTVNQHEGYNRVVVVS